MARRLNPLVYFTLTLLEEYKEGLKEGEDRVAALFKRMKADGRLQDFSDALKDKNAREKLYKEYGIE